MGRAGARYLAGDSFVVPSRWPQSKGWPSTSRVIDESIFESRGRPRRGPVVAHCWISE